MPSPYFPCTGRRSDLLSPAHPHVPSISPACISHFHSSARHAGIHPLLVQAYDFLIAIAEPVCRPECVHEYQLTPHSLYAAVSVGLETETIISVLNRLSKVQLSEEVKAFIRNSTQNYGKVRQEGGEEGAERAGAGV